MHGGTNDGAPKGNKNAVTTGEHETIFADCLEADERAFFDTIDTDKLAQVNEQIRLSSIRIRRMLRRIQDLGGEEYIRFRMRRREKTDEKVFEKGAKSSGGEAGLKVDRKERHSTTQVETEERSTLGLIQGIEEALTRVVREHAKLVNLKHQIERTEPPEDDTDVSGFLEALEGAAEEIDWPDPPEEEEQ